MQLHHKYDAKRLSAFTVRCLKGNELEKWARCQPDPSIDIAPELRELQLLVSHGRFRNEDFIVAERSRRFIGKARLRQLDETTLILDSPVVLRDFNFYRVARALVEYAVTTVRAGGRARSLLALLGQINHSTLRRAYEHLGFILLQDKSDDFLTTQNVTAVYVLAL